VDVGGRKFGQSSGWDYVLDPKRSANETTECPSIRNALRKLLDDLDAVFVRHGELGDTAVREELGNAIHSGFVLAAVKYRVPSRLGVFTAPGNRATRNALVAFLRHPEVVRARKAKVSRDARLAAFQDATVESRSGSAYDESFGHRDCA
jgi:hypothetical protein